MTAINKKQLYDDMLKEATGLVEGERDLIANTANIAALIFEQLNKFSSNAVNWSGFYFMRNNELVLGPFQGKPACIRIKVGRGVCGSTVANKKSMVVPDVHKFPGHIACDSASNSEVVVPVFVNDVVVAVIDLDSKEFNTFDEEDARGLEAIASLLSTSCDWNL